MDYEQSIKAFTRLFENQMEEQEAKELLIDLYQRGESADEIAAAAKVMREHAITLDIPTGLQDKLVEIVGTGGDKSGSFNISTTSAFVLAACGCHVAKHGNRSITSKSGSADVLGVLGVNLDLKPDQQVKLLEETGFAFMFAIHHHPAMKHIMPIRKSLDHRTIFNILGPLTNPAQVKKQLIGVFRHDFVRPISEALQKLESKNVMVVSGADGLDEISISDVTHCAHLVNGTITESIIDPRELGFQLAPLAAIQGGEANENAQITTDILQSNDTGAKLDIVLLNSGATLVVDGRASDLKEGIEIAKEAIQSGRAYEKLQQIAEVSQRL